MPGRPHSCVDPSLIELSADNQYITCSESEPWTAFHLAQSIPGPTSVWQSTSSAILPPNVAEASFPNPTYQNPFTPGFPGQTLIGFPDHNYASPAPPYPPSAQQQASTPPSQAVIAASTAVVAASPDTHRPPNRRKIKEKPPTKWTGRPKGYHLSEPQREKAKQLRYSRACWRCHWHRKPVSLQIL